MLPACAARESRGTGKWQVKALLYQPGMILNPLSSDKSHKIILSDPLGGAGRELQLQIDRC